MASMHGAQRVLEFVSKLPKHAAYLALCMCKLETGHVAFSSVCEGGAGHAAHPKYRFVRMPLSTIPKQMKLPHAIGST